MTRILSILLLTGAFAATSTAPVSGEDAPAELLAHGCVLCHGTEGRSSGDIPALTGHSAEEITNAMLDFREDRRENTIMGRLAKGLTDSEIDALATLIAQWE